MPFTLNGIGTWYYGRRNVFDEGGVCEFCGREVRLASYDTTEYFVVLFIPLLPLGRKRVLRECPSCRRHRTISLKEWKRLREEKLREAGEQYKNKPTQPAAARELIDAFVAFQESELFGKVAPSLRGSWIGNPVVTERLGQAFEAFGNLSEAEACYRDVLGQDATIGRKLDLARALLNQGKGIEAADLVRGAIETRDPRVEPYLLSTARTLQAEGKHEEALHFLEKVEETSGYSLPAKEIDRIRRVSEKLRGTGKRVGRKSHSGNGIRGPSALVIVLGALLLGAALFAGLSLWKGKHRTVHVVSGIEKPYGVAIGDETVRLNPYKPKSITIAEGEVTVRPISGHVEIEPARVSIRTSFWSRLFDKTVFVINPDRLALLYRASVTYRTTPRPDERPQFHYATGTALHRFERVDYPFQPFPDEIKMKEGAETRRRVGVVNPKDDGVHPATLIATEFGTDALRDHLAGILRFDPENEGVLFAYCSVLGPEDAIEFLRGGLDVGPVRLDWHRAYQEIVVRSRPEIDLVAEYTARLAINPEAAEWLYMLGRVSKPEDAAPLYVKAAEQEGAAGAYALGALAYQALAEARFEDALRDVRKALERIPDRAGFLAMESDALMGLRQYEKPIEQARRQAKLNPWSVDVQGWLVLMLAASGRDAEAKAAADAYSSRIKSAVLQKEYLESTAYLRAQMALGTGNAQAFMKEAESVEGYRPYGKMLRGDTRTADSIMCEQGITNAYFDLLLYIASDEKDAEHREEFLRRAVEGLERGDANERRMAGMLATGSATMDDLQRMGMDIGSKSIALTALGMRIPAIRKEVFVFAQELNVRRNTGGLLVHKRVSATP